MKLVRQGLVRKSLSSLAKDFQEPKFIQKLISELAPEHITLKQDLFLTGLRTVLISSQH